MSIEEAVPETSDAELDTDARAPKNDDCLLVALAESGAEIVALTITSEELSGSPAVELCTDVDGLYSAVGESVTCMETCQDNKPEVPLLVINVEAPAWSRLVVSFMSSRSEDTVV